MSYKRKTAAVLAGALVLGSLMTLCAGSTVANSEAVETVTHIATVQAFKDEPVKDEDVKTIVSAGMNAPSSMNGQPWHFSVVTSKDVLNEIGGNGFGGGKPDGFSGAPSGMPEGMTPPDGFSGSPSGMPEGMTPPSGGMSIPGGSGAKADVADAPLAIVISCKSGSELDAGLATENMSAAAQLLGYGTKIVSSPTMTLNGSRQAEFKQILGIPEDMQAVCVLLIGYAYTEAYDIVTSATARNSEADTVTYVK